MKEFINRYGLVTLLVLIAITMAITKIKYRDTNWENTSGTITPTIMPIKGSQNNDNYPLWELLPYTGKDFVVDRYADIKTLVIKTNNVKQNLVREEVYKWIKENKVATESHKLVFEKL